MDDFSSFFPSSILFPSCSFFLLFAFSQYSSVVIYSLLTMRIIFGYTKVKRTHEHIQQHSKQLLISAQNTHTHTPNKNQINDMNCDRVHFQQGYIECDGCMLCRKIHFTHYCFISSYCVQCACYYMYWCVAHTNRTYCRILIRKRIFNPRI